MCDEVWLTLTDIKKIFDETESEHLVVARYHGAMLADSVCAVDVHEEVIRDSRSRIWKLTDVHEGELHKFVRVMAKPLTITVYEAF